MSTHSLNDAVLSFAGFTALLTCSDVSHMHECCSRQKRCICPNQTVHVCQLDGDRMRYVVILYLSGQVTNRMRQVFAVDAAFDRGVCSTPALQLSRCA